MKNAKIENATFWVIFKHCDLCSTVKFITKNVLVSLIWVETPQTCFAGPGTISAVPPTDYHSGPENL